MARDTSFCGFAAIGLLAPMLLAVACGAPTAAEGPAEIVVTGTVIETRSYALPSRADDVPLRHRLAITLEPEAVAWADGSDLPTWRERLGDHLDAAGRATFVARDPESGPELPEGTRVRVHLDGNHGVKGLSAAP